MSDAERRARRREVALRHHPDRGGDPAEFDRALRALDDAPAGGSVPAGRHEVVLVPSPRTRLRRRIRATGVTVSAHLPTPLTTHLGRLARLTRRTP